MSTESLTFAMTESEIPSEAPQDQVHQLPDGGFVRTGNLAPDTEAGKVFYGTNLFADAVGVLSKDKIAKLLNAPGRKAGRLRFDPSKWIKNQGRRGSCNPYACCGALERARVIRGEPFVQLGPEFMYAHINGGRDAGSGLAKSLEASEVLGCPPKEYVKYESYKRNEQTPEGFANAERFRSAEGFAIHTEDELATAIALNMPCVVAVHVNNNWMKLDGDGIAGGANGAGNHAIGLHDLRINSQGGYEFDHFGSWGLRYGDKGHAWTTWRRHYATTIRYHQFYAFPTTRDDQGDAQQLPPKG